MAGGADAQHKLLKARVLADPGSLLVALDARNAFGSIHREAAATAVSKFAPFASHLSDRLFRRITQAVWRDSNGSVHHLPGGAGIPQGCPLSAAAYAVALHTCMHELERQHPEWFVTVRYCRGRTGCGRGAVH